MEEERPRLRDNSRPFVDVAELAAREPTRAKSSDFELLIAKLKAENDELKVQLFELRTELQDERNNEKFLKREQQVETKMLREEERKKAQSMVIEVRRKLYKEKQQEVCELRDRLQREKEKEIANVVKQKDEELKKAQHNWNREKEELIQKLRIQFSSEMREAAQKSYEKQVGKLEKCIEELKEQKKELQESCKLAQEADKRKAEQIRRIHSEHKNELAKLKRSSWQEGRKQMAEIRQLTNIIHQLEKKLGVESGHYIRLEMEKECLKDKLDRVKGSETSGKRSPSFAKPDLSRDLSFFSFPSADDSNPLWFQLKQQKSTIAQLKQNLQDKNRRIDLLKQKLYKNRGRIGRGGLLHRSMDDMLSYDTTAERDECLSPQFGYSTGSSESSSVNDESILSDENQESEIIRKLRKELLTLEKSYSLLQAQTESALDGKRNQMEREQLQTDLIEAQRQIDELNSALSNAKKELADSRDRNDLLEFQLQEALHGNDSEDHPGFGFNIPTLCVDYEFTDEELECSAEEVKVKLEELENEKKPLLSRDEQLALLQARTLIDSINKGQLNLTYNLEKDHMTDGQDKLSEESFPVSDESRGIQSVSCNVGVQCQLMQSKNKIYNHRKALRDLHDEGVFKEVVTGIESAVQCNIMEMKLLYGGEIIEVVDENLRNCIFRKVVPSSDLEVQTDFSELFDKMDNESERANCHDSVSGVELGEFTPDCQELYNVNAGVEKAVQCDVIEMKVQGYDMVVEIHDGNLRNCRFKKCTESHVKSVQTDFPEFGDYVDKSETERAVQCDIMVVRTHSGEETIEIHDENFRNCRFRKVGTVHDTSVQTDFSELDKDLSKNETETGVQCNMEMKTNDGNEVIEILDENLKSWQYRTKSCDITVQSEAAEFHEHVSDIQPRGRTEFYTDQDFEEDLKIHENVESVPGIESAVQCNIMDFKSFGGDKIIEIYHESGCGRFKEVVSSRDSATQTDFLEFGIFDDETEGEEGPETGEECVKEKHDRECSEKSLLGRTWKTLIKERELDEDVRPLDCVVYEQKDLLVVICESSRRYCKEVYVRDNVEEDSTTLFSNNNENMLGGADDTPTTDGDGTSKCHAKCDVGVQCNIAGGGESLQSSNLAKQTVDTSTQYLSSAISAPEFQSNDTRDINQIAFMSRSDGKILPRYIQDQSTQRFVGGELGDDCDGEHVGRDLPGSMQQTVNISEHFYQTLKKTRNVDIQCPENGHSSSRKIISCLYCGRDNVTLVDSGIQCDFAELLSSGSGTFDIPGTSGLSSVFQGTDEDSLIKEVMELAKECSQNDVLIDRHLTEVVKSQEFYSEFQEEEGLDTIDASVQCDMIVIPQLCDKGAQCIMGESVGEDERMEACVERGTQCIPTNGNYSSRESKLWEISRDVSLQCSLLKWIQTTDQATQWDTPDVCLDYSTHAEKGVLCNILVSTETCDKEIQYIVCEKDDEELEEGLGQQDNFGPEDEKDNVEYKDQVVYRDLYNEISNSEVHEELLDAENISLNFPDEFSRNSENSYDEIVIDNNPEDQWKVPKDSITQCDFRELNEKSDKSIQCNLLDDRNCFGNRIVAEGVDIVQDVVLDGNNSEGRTDMLLSVRRSGLGLYPENVQNEVVPTNEGPNDGISLIEKEIPEEAMLELASLKVKNQNLRQQVVELRLQVKRERDKDSEVYTGERDPGAQHRGDLHQSLPVSASIPLDFGLEASVKPTIRDTLQEEGLRKDNIAVYSEEGTIIAEKALETLLDVDLDDVFREMEAKSIPPVLEITLTPQAGDCNQLPSTFVEEAESSADSEVVLGETTRTELESRSPAEEPTITRSRAAGWLHQLDETLRMFGDETLKTDNKDNRKSSDPPPNECNVEGLEQMVSEGTGVENKESLFPEGEQATLPPPPAEILLLGERCDQLTMSESEGSYPPLPLTDPPLTPDSLPPTPPPLSPPGILENDLDEDIEALLAEDGDGVVNPTGVRSTLDHEVQALLQGESSSVSSEPDTVLSMDSLCVNQTGQVTRDSEVSSQTEAMTSLEHDDVILPNVQDWSAEVFRPSPSKPDYDVQSLTLVSTESNLQDKASERHVAFRRPDSVSDSSSASADVGQRRKPTPPPVFPKPKHRPLSTKFPFFELPRVPVAAQQDMVDGHFPPPGLVPKRANEFNLGEYDLLKERIVFLERQLKNKENLLQSMRAEATEIETSAYIQKKEQDLKMMDESVRFLKQENQKKEKELIVKIGELNKCSFELEQLRSERANSERQREKMEETIGSMQLNRLQSVDVQFQELKCRNSTLEKENAELQEQVNRLHRADEEFVELERTISSLQEKLKELEDIKRERDVISQQLEVVKTEKEDLVQKGRKVETERNDFFMNNKLIEQQKENLEARNKSLQRTNDTFKTKISSLEKEFRDCQRRLFDVQRERDEASSQLRKLEAERNELRKRVNELLECKSELKQSRSKSHDLERELNFLRSQYRKLEGERAELSSELGNVLKERNRLEGREAELEQLSRSNEKLEEKFHTLKIKIAELTSQRDDAEVQLPTLKAKIALLKKACKEKDEQLEKLQEEIRELKHSIATSALDDLSKIRTYGFNSPENFVKFGGNVDLNNNTSQVTPKKVKKGEKYVVLFDYDPSRLSTTGHPEKELKLSEGDVITVYGEMDLDGYYLAELDGTKGLVSSLYIEEMDEHDIRRVPKRRELQSDKSSPKEPPIPVPPPKLSSILPEPVKRPFVALQDYDPFTSSTSGRPDIEIPLTAGEVVTVVGDVDTNGYYTVEQRGRLAIIPSNLVKPSSPPSLRPGKLNFSSPPQKTVKALSSVPLRSVPGTSTVNGLNGPFTSHSSVRGKQPATEGVSTSSTSGLKEDVLRHKRQENVLDTKNYPTVWDSRGTVENKLSTIQPALPEAPRNLRVLRCVNKDSLLLSWTGPEIDEMGRNNGHIIKGYKILTNGQVKLEVDSPYMAKALVENLDLCGPIELAIQTAANNGLCSEQASTHFNEALVLETTSVSTEDVPSLDDGLPYKTFIALYNYNPIENSPNPNPANELEFQEGDIIRVLDVSRPDGFYLGKVDGKQGLVPSNFIEEVAIAARPGSMKFKKVSDGFHDDDITGEKGPIPSSFLKDYQQKSSKSAHSTNGYASLPRRVQFVNQREAQRIPTGYV